MILSFSGTDETAAVPISTILAYPSGRRRSTSGRDSQAQRRVSPVDIRRRVLIVGRIRELALYRAEVLYHHGYRAFTPETQEEAIAIIQTGDFDVAVLSYTLPDTTVQELAEILRAYSPDRPIIAISESRLVDRRVAPDAVVLAQQGPAALIRALRRVLRQR